MNRTVLKKNLPAEVRSVLLYHGDAYNTLYLAYEAILKNDLLLAKSHICDLTGQCCAGATTAHHKRLRGIIFEYLITS